MNETVREVLIAATDYVNQRRFGLFKDEPKRFTELADAVDDLLTEMADNDGEIPE